MLRLSSIVFLTFSTMSVFFVLFVVFCTLFPIFSSGHTPRRAFHGRPGRLPFSPEKRSSPTSTALLHTVIVLSDKSESGMQSSGLGGSAAGLLMERTSKNDVDMQCG